MKMFILGFAALLATGSAFADTQTTAPVIHDKTGFFVHLDVAKVLSSTDICGNAASSRRNSTTSTTRIASTCWTTRSTASVAPMIIDPATLAPPLSRGIAPPMNILVVEDEPKAGNYLLNGLQELGYSVSLARDGVDGLHLALEHDSMSSCWT